MRISDRSSDVCSSDLPTEHRQRADHDQRDRHQLRRLVRVYAVLPAPVAVRLGGEEGQQHQSSHVERRDTRTDQGGDADHDVLGERGLDDLRSEEHTSELQSLMRISYAVFCLKKKNLTTDPTRVNLV